MKKFLVISMVGLTAMGMGCGSRNAAKRVVIMASGKVILEGNTISLDPSFTHTEADQTFKDDKLQLTLKKTGDPDKTFTLDQDGVYVINLQNDTLIGSTINYGEQGRPGRITAEMLDHIIDSTKALMNGSSTAKDAYFLPPLTLKKVSDKLNTKVIGAYKGIPYSNEADNTGKVPDVIKFFTNKDKREALEDLINQKEKIK